MCSRQTGVVRTLLYLVGEELQDQVTFSLNLRRTRARLQLEPGVKAANGDLLS